MYWENSGFGLFCLNIGGEFNQRGNGLLTLLPDYINRVPYYYSIYARQTTPLMLLLGLR